MTPNHVKQKLRAGQPSIGSWLNLGSPSAAEAMATLGFDRLCVDMEHGPTDLSAMAAMLTAVGRYPVVPLARIPTIDELAIKRVLDAGAWGFVAPNVRSRELTYFRKANDEILNVAQIEHGDAIRKIDDILSVPGLDACYTGSNDLCASCGMTPATEPADPEFDAMMQTLLQAARRHGVVPGIHCATPEYASRRLTEGWKLVGIVNDLRFMAAAAKAARDQIRA